MATENTMDFSGVTMEISASDLVKFLLPQIITALQNNPTLLNALTSKVTNKQLASARRTGSVLGNAAGTNKNASASRINTNAQAR